MRIKWLVAAAILIAAGGSFGLLQRVQKVTVAAASVSTADLDQSIETTGVVEAAQTNIIFSPLDGVLSEVKVKVGDSVKKGQQLAVFKEADITLQRLQLETQIAQAQADWDSLHSGLSPEDRSQLENAVSQQKVRYEAAQRAFLQAQRTPDPQKDDAVAQAETDLKLAESNYQAAMDELAQKEKGPSQAELDLATARLKQLQYQKQQFEEQAAAGGVTADTGGTVTEVNVKPGQPVSKGTPFFSVADLAQLQITAAPDESLAAQLSIGQKAVVHWNGSDGDRTWQAKVVRMAPAAVQGQGQKTTLPITLELTGDPAPLRPGYRVDIDLISQSAGKVPQVPNEAVQQLQDGSAAVWTVQQGKAHRVSIQTGLKNDRSQQVISGLHEGEQVILSPPQELKEGKPVKLLQEAR